MPHFRHREAIHPRPTYASQRDSGSERINRQRWELRRRLGDDFTDLFSEPFKPKWMRQKTFTGYATRDAELAGMEGPVLARMIARCAKQGLEPPAWL